MKGVENDDSLEEENTYQSQMEWWKGNKGRYPLLSQLAASYLAIPSRSVPCERVFSTAGHIVNEKRALSPSYQCQYAGVPC